MDVAKHWTVDVFIDEHEEERRTRAEARLHTREGSTLKAVGIARRNPLDAEIPEIGDELAVARALSDLAHKLFDAAAQDIQGAVDQRAWLHG